MKKVEFVIKRGSLARYIGPGDDVTVPDGVTDIDDTSFADNVNVTGVTLPDGVRHIGRCAFFGCTNLRTISIPAEGVEKIWDNAFDAVPALPASPSREASPRSAGTRSRAAPP